MVYVPVLSRKKIKHKNKDKNKDKKRTVSSPREMIDGNVRPSRKVRRDFKNNLLPG